MSKNFGKTVKLIFIVVCLFTTLLIVGLDGEDSIYVYNAGTEDDPVWQARVIIGDSWETIKVFEDGNGERHLFLPAGAGTKRLDASGGAAGIKVHMTKGTPAVFIRSDKDYSEFTAEHDLKAYTDISIYDGDGRQSFSGTVRFKGHGNGSWDNNPKKSWGLFFDEETSILGLSEGRRYVALSNAQDQSYARNAITFELARYLELPYTPGYTFADMYFNGDYLGLYQITERVEAGPLRVDVNKNDPPGRIKKRLGYVDEDGMKYYVYPEGYEPDSSFGVIVCEEGGDARYSKIEAGYVEDDGYHFEIVYPQYPSKSQAQMIKNYTDSLHRAIDSEDGFIDGPGGTVHYSEMIDVPSFALKYLVEQISSNRDGNIGSSYYYIPELYTSHEGETVFIGMPRIFQGPVWDYDIAYGNYTLNAMWAPPEGWNSLRPGLDKRPEFLTLIKELYAQYLSEYLKTEFPGIVEDVYESTRDSAAMDQLRWKGNRFWFCEGQREAVDSLKSYISARTVYLDDIWINDIEYYRVNFVFNDRIVHTVYLKAGNDLGSALARRNIPEDYSHLTAYDYDNDEPLDPDMIPTDYMAFELR